MRRLNSSKGGLVMKKVLVIGATLLAVGMMQPATSIISGNSISAATITQGQFSDVIGHWAQSDIELLAGMGVIEGYRDGNFRPEGTITRAEFSKILSQLMNLEGNNQAFSDTTGHWAESEINGLVENGIILTSEDPNGYSPDTQINRMEMSKMVARSLAHGNTGWESTLSGLGQLDVIDVPFNDQNQMSVVELPYIALANSSGIITGYRDGTFRKDRTATRAEATTMLKRYLDAKDTSPNVSQLIEQFKGEVNVHQFTKAELEAWIDREADLERLRNIPIQNNDFTTLEESNNFWTRTELDKMRVEINYFEPAVDIMDIYFNRDYRTIGEDYINALRYYFKARITYDGVFYNHQDLPKLMDYIVQQTKNEKRISESVFVSDVSMFHQQITNRWENRVRGTQYIRYTSGTNLPTGVELNKWYKRDVDMQVVNAAGNWIHVTWETSTWGFGDIHQLSPYQEVK